MMEAKAISMPIFPQTDPNPSANRELTDFEASEVASLSDFPWTRAQW
jgi:hypothetical protein